MAMGSESHRTRDVVSRVLAPAKVNWTLDLVDKRADGFHELETVVSTITLADEVTVATAAGSSGVRVTCNDPSTPTDGRNLAHRAATALGRRSGLRAAVEIDLSKRIPAGAGLGGGSTDAAATLRGLNGLWGLGWSTARLMPVAAAVGSDVPPLLVGGTVVARGRGEFVEPAALAWSGVIVVVMPKLHVSTAAVYGAVRAEEDLHPASGAAKEFLEAACTEGATAAALMERSYNALEGPALRRFAALGELRAQLHQRFARPWRLCGSGSAMFTAYDKEDDAAACAGALRNELQLRAEVVRLAPASAEAP
jgi:4-diphosphocytidyl-2-C-methyl-D-erythritol kinase